jgi:transmembrane sensor
MMSPSQPHDEEASRRAELAAEWAVRLTDDDISRKSQEEFADWLRSDAHHGEMLEEILAAWGAVDRHAASSQVVAMRQAALAEGRRALNARRPLARVRTRTWLAAAAVLLAVLGGGLWKWLSPQVYSTGVGERRVVVLPDGSRITLDAATRVRVAYSRDRRRLWLERGRAKFDVAKNPLRPFSVTAADKVVVATGTSFSVERIDDQVRVVLYEGHVLVLEKRAGHAPYPVPLGPERVPAGTLLTADRELILPIGRLRKLRFEPAPVKPVNPARSLSWESGLLVFDDEPLPIAVARMNRYSRKPLRLGDSAVARLRISGVFRAGDTDALIEGLEAEFGIEAQPGRHRTMLFEPRHGAQANSPST